MRRCASWRSNWRGAARACCGSRAPACGRPVAGSGAIAGACRASPAVVVLACLRRGRRAARVLARMAPGFLWRWGLKSAYGWEQATFWLRLAPTLRRGGFDILHVQDPMLAYWCRAWRRRGWLTTREILAHGTEEPLEFLDKFEYVQHLAPWHLIESRKQKAQMGGDEVSIKLTTRGGGRVLPLSLPLSLPSSIPGKTKVRIKVKTRGWVGVYRLCLYPCLYWGRRR